MKIFGLGITALVIKNEEMEHMEIFKYLEESGLWKKDVSKTIEHEAKEQKGGFLGLLLRTLVASLF